MKFKKLVESFGSENKMTIRVASGLNADGCDINEDVNDGKEEDKFVLYFPYLEPKIISKDRAIKQMEFELNEFKNNSGASVAGRGFGIYCLQSYDPDTDSVWTGRYSSKEFLKVLDESMLREAFDTTLDFPYMFFYNCNNPTFGYDFQLFASSLGARKVYGRYKGTGAGTYFYLVPSKEVYEKLKAVAKDKYTVEMQRLLPYDAEKYPKIQYIKESLNEDIDDAIWSLGHSNMSFADAKKHFQDLRADIKLLFNCETVEEVFEHESEFKEFNCANIIKRKLDKGMSPEDALDFMSDYLMRTWNQWKTDMAVFKSNADKAMAAFNAVKNALSKYELISADEERCVLKYRPIEGATHKDCVEFVDAVVAAVDGKYDFTGRGGSWTRWDIRTADGIMLKAGWDDHGDTWSVTFPRLKFEALTESFEMAAGGDDFDGEIAAMRAEQKELEARRAARKERFALMHKLFDKHMNADPNAKWIDKIYDLFEDAEKVMFIGNKYGTLPGKTEDGQPIKYRYSIEEYDIYTDPYREFVYITTNKNDLSESLKEVPASWNYYPYALYSYTPGDAETGIEGDKFDIIDVVKSADEDEAKRYFKSKRMWYPNTYVDRISEDDYNAFLKEREEWSMYESAVTRYNKFADEEVNEALEEERKTQYVICGVTNEGTRMLYDAVNDNFTTDYASATKYDDMEVARDDWFKIPRSGFRRIFIPVYDPAVFESVNEAFDADKVQKRIACTTEFDNGHVFHNDYFRASAAEAEERAKQASIENPDKVFYVKYDDVMNPSSDIKWKNGEQLNEADEPIYFDPDNESEVDFRYYVYANNDDVVSDAFDFEEDAISWAQENNYPIVKIHNYYRDTDGELNPDGDPEVVWEA